MSTAHSNPMPAIDQPHRPAWLLMLACLLFAAPLLAAQGDRQKTIQVTADHFEASQGSGVTTLRGHVVITQGTLKASAAEGIAHTNEDGTTERIVLHGSPAHLQQRTDDGSLMQARADTIEYRVDASSITLNGHAHVEQPGQGTFTGAHLVYNPDTGAIRGSGGNQGRVHLTLEPRHSDSDSKSDSKSGSERGTEPSPTPAPRND